MTVVYQYNIIVLFFLGVVVPTLFNNVQGEGKAKEPNQWDVYKNMLTSEEGFRAKPYVDSVGKRTIGTGFNLDDPTVAKLVHPDVLSGKRDITQEENDAILNTLLLRARKDAESFVGSEDVFNNLNPGQQATLISMAYQMGLPRLNKFNKLRAAALAGDADRGAQEILNSLAAKQAPNRFKRNALMFKTGVIK